MQPTPKPNSNQPIHEQVIEDIKFRAEAGKQNYGTYLQAGNGRDSLLDAYEEAQDKALYLKQAILERDDLVMELEAAREEVDSATRNWKLTQERATRWAKESTALAAHVERLRAALDRAFEGAARQLAEPRHHGNDQYALTDIATTCELALAAAPAQSLAAHDAAVKVAVLLAVAEKLRLEESTNSSMHAEFVEAEADRIEKEAQRG